MPKILLIGYLLLFHYLFRLSYADETLQNII